MHIHKNDLLPNHYRVYTSYSLPSLRELKREFDYVSCLFDHHWTWERHSSCANIDETPGECEYFIAEFPKEFLCKKAESILSILAEYFDERGYRFATELEVIDFAKALKDFQRENRILALGSSTTRGGDYRYFSLLHARPSLRYLDDTWLDLPVFESDRLLVIRR